MIITELGVGGSAEYHGVRDECVEMVKVGGELEGRFYVRDGGEIVNGKAMAKMVLVGAGARILFYPTLMYNVIRNKLQTEFRWWDEIDQCILLGAVPFPADVPRLRPLGVGGVITLNEPYETLVPSSLYQFHGIDHLVIPTRDYLFAPSFVDICQAVDFIHRNASCGRTTYVHCKAGRGRSTTIVICYLVEYKHMTPAAALDYVRSRRPRVLLAPSQWQAVQEYSRRKVELHAIQSSMPKYLLSGDELVISEADLDGYSAGGAANDENVCLFNISEDRPVIVKHKPTILGEDGVLITEADLEGYGSFVNSTNVTRPLTGRLSCLLSSFKFSSGGQSAESRLHEIRAC